MKAKRINGFVNINPEMICYYRTPKGVWMLFHPVVGLGNLAQHDVTEHEDGTISVSPSIRITTKRKGQQVSIHGYLKNGIWTD